MPLNCGTNKRERNVSHTVRAIDARTACMYALEFAERLAWREARTFRNQACPDKCPAKVMRRESVTVVRLVGRWNRQRQCYEATATVKYVVEVDCNALPPPPVPKIPVVPLPPPPPPGGEDEERPPSTEPVEPPAEEPVEPEAPVEKCNAACTCMGPRCFIPQGPGHGHCPFKATEGSGNLEDAHTGCFAAGGHCTLPQHTFGTHWCTHGHSF